jgi:hypothetical protein
VCTEGWKDGRVGRDGRDGRDGWDDDSIRRGGREKKGLKPLLDPAVILGFGFGFGFGCEYYVKNITLRPFPPLRLALAAYYVYACIFAKIKKRSSNVVRVNRLGFCWPI